VIEPYYPFNNSSVEDFTIGREDCEDRYIDSSLKLLIVYCIKYAYFGRLFPDTGSATAL
jgi:cadherin 5 type 2 (VE-cadherin)